MVPRGFGDDLVKIYVGNLSFQTSESELRDLFSQHGEVKDATILLDRETGRSRGFGFIEMEDDSGKNAISALDGSDFGGRNLKVNEARPRNDRPRDSGGGGRRW